MAFLYAIIYVLRRWLEIVWRVIGLHYVIGSWLGPELALAVLSTESVDGVLCPYPRLSVDWCVIYRFLRRCLWVRAV